MDSWVTLAGLREGKTEKTEQVGGMGKKGVPGAYHGE